MRQTRSLYHGVIAALAVVVGVGGRPASADPQQQHVLYLLDTTGSMGDLSSGGLTKLEVAKARIKADLDTVQPLPTTYAVWRFDGASFTQLYSFTDVKTIANMKAVVDAQVLGGATPLADSICSAVDSLLAYLPAGNPTNVKRIFLATDGLENNSIGECSGPPSDPTLSYPTLTPHSWQWRVRNKACVGAPEPSSPVPVCPNGVPTAGNPITLLVDIDHLFDDNIGIPPFAPFAAAASRLDPERGARASAVVTTAAVNADAAFFTGLTHEKHGRYHAITQSTPLAAAVPIPGDVNLDGCVNITDRALVLQQFGGPGTADLNGDGVVNTFDLQTVLQNFGSGCTP